MGSRRKGQPTTDPYEVRGLLPISGPKGYGLMMMVDVLAGSLLAYLLANMLAPCMRI